MPHEEVAFARVMELMEQMAERRLLRRSQIPGVSYHTLRGAYTTGKISIRTLARVCEALGFDLVLNVRDRR